MKAAIFTIGNEVLTGKTLNTNSYFLARLLAGYGFEVVKHLTVEDNEKIIIRETRKLMDEVDLIVTTGGLGPTYDDITIESIAKACNKELVFFPEIMEDIEIKFQHYGSKMNDNNKRQAYLIDGSEVLPNQYGTAPGMYYSFDNTIIISLPGPPKENIPMFENHVLPKLNQLGNGEIVIKDLVIFGVGESNVEVILNEKLETTGEIRIATYVKPRYVVIRMTSKNKELIKEYTQKIIKIFGNKVVGEDDMTLEKFVVEKMSSCSMELSLAESCTGGMIASHIVNVPGSSEILNRSIVTYSNQAKIDELQVKPETLGKYGAVSSETALEMVRGLSAKTASDVCLAVTGIAGPGGGSDSKPVGLTFIAIKSSKNEQVHEYTLFGDRETIRHRASLIALNLIRLELLV
jgi:nicotinamide-nucleotide amidase